MTFVGSVRLFGVNALAVVAMTAPAQAMQMVPLNPSGNGCGGDDCIMSSYAVATAAIGTVELFTIAFNSGLVGGGRSSGWVAPLGVLAGGLGIALGAVNLDKENEALALGVVNMGVGAVSLGLGLKAWLRSEQTSMGAARRAEPRVQPTYTQTWDARRRLGVRMRF